MTEAILKESVRLVARELEHWSARSPALIVSALRDFSIPTVLEIVAATPETGHEGFLVQTLANLILARYAEAGYLLEPIQAELAEVFEARDRRLPVAVAVLEKIKAISFQLQLTGTQARQQPSYHAIGRLATELLEKVEPGELALHQRGLPLPRPERAASTGELELDGEPERIRLRASNTAPLRKPTDLQPRQKTAQDILYSHRTSQFILDFSAIEDYMQRRELLLFWLPRFYDLLETWDENSPLKTIELVRSLPPREAVQYSAYLMPHRHQAEFLRVLGIGLHLCHFLDAPLPYLPGAVAEALDTGEKQVQAILPALAYRIFCSSTAFYAIQEQAIRKLGFQRNYFYHLITLEWLKNKTLTETLRAHPAMDGLKDAEHLAQGDWEFIFVILNQGLARSVIKDVYGVFHGSTTFADKIVDPQTSKGFGHGIAAAAGSFFTLTTSQISEWLEEHGQMEFELSDRVVQFQQYVQDRFRRLESRESRPLLNFPTLKRIEQLIHQIFQRGRESYLSYETVAFELARECLSLFTHLSPEQFGWLVYQLTTYTIQAAQQLNPRLDECVRGLVGALLAAFSQEIYQKRPLEAEGIFQYCWHGLFYSIQDAAWLDLRSPELAQQLQNLGLESLQKMRDRFLEPFRKDQLKAILAQGN